MQPTPTDKGVRYLREPGFLWYMECPGGSVAEAVTRSWTISASRCQTSVERVLPDAGTMLYVNLGPVGRHLVEGNASTSATAPRAAWIVGPHAAPLFVAKETANCEIIGARLRAGVIPHVFGVPAAELMGQLVDLDLLWGRQTVERVRAQLSSEVDPLKRLRLLRNEIQRLALAASHETVQIRRLCSALADVPNPSIRSIARRFQMSHRRVIQIFDMYVGLKPKAFQRVTRLGFTLDRMSGEPSGSWARIAYEAGYSDQAHLANEFRRLTGLTTSAYSRSRSPIDVGVVRHQVAEEPGA